MKFRLKNKELQAKLDEISNGDFSRRLENISRRIHEALDNNEKGVFGQLYFGEKIRQCERFTILLCYKDLEIVQEYDPYSWNKFPEIKPPSGVLMRCEKIDHNGRTHHFCATFYLALSGNGNWIDDNSNEVTCDRFRPWED